MQHHFNMLSDGARMDGFRRAIQLAVRPGMKVADLGGGTGVLSWFAARQGAERVWCVELLPEMATAARAALDDNEDGDALRMVIKNVLGIDGATGQTAEWIMSYLVVPLPTPLLVHAGDAPAVAFDYLPGDELHAFTGSLSARLPRVDLRELVPR